MPRPLVFPARGLGTSKCSSDYPKNSKTIHWCLRTGKHHASLMSNGTRILARGTMTITPCTIPPRANGFANTSIVHLTDIQQTCQLFPKFGRADVDRDWMTDTILDQCTAFYLNNWGSMYAYKSIW
ncbi:hypothetical protein DFH08DRAFT_757211 [Mycena albidolilacea]|uniref:Uncharacterized protein n=1 Tax=Mycena albidolilacea TaxID=1033008 RepID=A0AAD7ECD5_9AGAR|nr:hypothetical protein DFH08DRAFT_757211 [Mycena albidolilacea]